MFIALVLSLALNALLVYLNHKEKSELHIRLASKSLQEAEFYLEEYSRSLDLGEKKVKEKIKAEKSMTAEEKEASKEAEKF